MHLRCSVTFLLSRVPRTISERNTKKEQTLNKIQKNYSHLQTRSESAQYSKCLKTRLPVFLLPTPACSTTPHTPLTYYCALYSMSYLVAIYLTRCVGNRGIIVRLDAGCAGCARTTRLHWYAYALVHDAQAMQIVSTPRSVPLCFLSILSLSYSFLFPLDLFLKSL